MFQGGILFVLYDQCSKTGFRVLGFLSSVVNSIFQNRVSCIGVSDVRGKLVFCPSL